MTTPNNKKEMTANDVSEFLTTLFSKFKESASVEKTSSEIPSAAPATAPTTQVKVEVLPEVSAEQVLGFSEDTCQGCCGCDEQPDTQGTVGIAIESRDSIGADLLDVLSSVIDAHAENVGLAFHKSVTSNVGHDQNSTFHLYLTFSGMYSDVCIAVEDVVSGVEDVLEYFPQLPGLKATVHHSVSASSTWGV